MGDRRKIKLLVFLVLWMEMFYLVFMLLVKGIFSFYLLISRLYVLYSFTLYNYFIVLFKIAFILIQPLAARTIINSCVNNKVGRPHREWVDDIVDWCRASLQELSYSAQDRTKWNEIIKESSDTNGRWAQSCCWWWWLGMCGNRISVRFRFLKTLTEPKPKGQTRNFSFHGFSQNRTCLIQTVNIWAILTKL